jgi:hypothetical protein
VSRTFVFGMFGMAGGLDVEGSAVAAPYIKPSARPAVPSRQVCAKH